MKSVTPPADSADDRAMSASETFARSNRRRRRGSRQCTASPDSAWRVAESQCNALQQRLSIVFIVIAGKQRHRSAVSFWHSGNIAITKAAHLEMLRGREDRAASGLDCAARVTRQLCG